MDSNDVLEYAKKVSCKILEWEKHLLMGKICEWLLDAETIIWAGNGGSGATATHMAGEFAKEIGKRSICLNDSMHVLTAMSNDRSYEVAFSDYYDSLRTQGSTVLVVYSSSGESENILRLVANAILRGDKVIAFTGSDTGSKLGHPPNSTVGWCGGSNAISINLGLDPLYSHAVQVAEDVHMVFSHMIFKMCLDTLEDSGTGTAGQRDTSKQSVPLRK